MTAPALTGISHLDLSVSDVEVSAAWYEQVFGFTRVRRVDLPSRTMVVLISPGTGLVVGLNAHAARPDGPFDERRVGLDHVGFAVAERGDLDAWEAHLTAHGVEHSPVADTGSGAALVFRDPDHIQLEMWWSKPATDVGTSREPEGATMATSGTIRRGSRYGVEETVHRLTDAARARGITVFATIDHALGARSAGIDMPETQVLIVGNPAVGTPAMLAAPDLALALPTRLLVRAAASGTEVVFEDPAALATRYGLTPEHAAALGGISHLVTVVET
ncbi:MAG: VOC family protein [Micrococcales bacterium]|nr:VOC family protein [Micrococcales bacterium]